jgi:hypothetical protein
MHVCQKKSKNKKKLQQVLMITSFVCVVVGGPSQGICYTHIHIISYCFSGNVNTPLPHVAYFIYLYQHVFMLAIVFSVLLRHTDSDYPSGIFKLFLHHIYLYYSSKQQLSNGRTLHINSETKTHISCQKKISALFLR